MWSFLKRWFPFLFPEEKEQPQTPIKDRGLNLDKVKPKPSTDSSTPTKRLDVEGKKVLRLLRTEFGETYTKGILEWEGESLVYTLEGPSPSPNYADRGAIREGDYYLELRKSGGPHTSYHFRFGDWHKGMIQIKEAPGLDYAYFMMGNDAELSYGNILVGMNYHQEHLLDSEPAYRKLYEQVIPNLENNGEVLILRIEEKHS